MLILAMIYTHIIKMHKSCDKPEKRVDLAPLNAPAELRVVVVAVDVGVLRVFADVVWLDDVVRLVDELDDDPKAVELPVEKLGLRLVAEAEVVVLVVVPVKPSPKRIYSPITGVLVPPTTNV